jgi:putative hydrolase of the HAD superfamily
MRITGLSADRLERAYWKDRNAYDEGKLTGVAFWHNVVRDAGLNLAEREIAELNLWDMRMWTRGDPAMLAWQLAIKERGLLTAIVSNMGVWSYQLGIAKPNPAIYRYALEKLGTQPAETLFIDDKAENVDAAVALGMKGIVFSDVEKLRTDLIESGMSNELPLP